MRLALHCEGSRCVEFHCNDCCVCSFQELLSPEDSFEDEMELEFKRDSLK